MPPTIWDVARRAGVSIATVSRVLNRSAHPVRPQVRERVELAARELDFQPSSLARGLAGRQTRTLGLIVPDIANPYYPRLSRGAEDIASARGYALIICNTDHRAEKLQVYLRLLREKRVDGVLLAGGGHEDAAEVELLAAAELPIHSVGRHPLDAPAVRIDNLEAGRLASQHLLNLGRRELAFVGGPASHTTVADRRAGYQQALISSGLTPDPSRELEVSFSAADGEQAAQTLLAHSRPPDAIFAFNDYLAIGAIKALVAGGRRVPEDVAVIGFDDIPLAAYFRPSLSSVAVPAYDLGSVAADRLIRQLSGERINDTVWLSTQVVSRESTASA